jgi:hypothetical protein
MAVLLLLLETRGDGCAVAAGRVLNRLEEARLEAVEVSGRGLKVEQFLTGRDLCVNPTEAGHHQVTTCKSKPWRSAASEAVSKPWRSAASQAASQPAACIQSERHTNVEKSELALACVSSIILFLISKGPVQ